MKFKRLPFAFIFLIIFFYWKDSSAQRIYAEVPATATGWVTNPSFASDVNRTNAAEINFGILNLKYSIKNNSGTTTFIRVDVPGLTTSNYNMIGLEIFQDNSNVTAGSSIRVVQNGLETYLAVTPCADYNSLQISYFGLFTTAKVYYAFTGFDSGECNAGWAIPLKPNIVQNTLAYCQDSTATATISNPICGLKYTWYEGATVLQAGTSSSYTMPINYPAGTHNLTVAASRPECGVESSKESITVTVNPKPIKPNVQPIN